MVVCLKQGCNGSNMVQLMQLLLLMFAFLKFRIAYLSGALAYIQEVLEKRLVSVYLAAWLFVCLRDKQ